MQRPSLSAFPFGNFILLAIGNPFSLSLVAFFTARHVVVLRVPLLGTSSSSIFCNPLALSLVDSATTRPLFFRTERERESGLPSKPSRSALLAEYTSLPASWPYLFLFFLSFFCFFGVFRCSGLRGASGCLGEESDGERVSGCEKLEQKKSAAAFVLHFAQVLVSSSSWISDPLFSLFYV